MYMHIYIHVYLLKGLRPYIYIYMFSFIYIYTPLKNSATKEERLCVTTGAPPGSAEPMEMRSGQPSHTAVAAGFGFHVSLLGLGFRVQGSGFRVQGSGFRV